MYMKNNKMIKEGLYEELESQVEADPLNIFEYNFGDYDYYWFRVESKEGMNQLLTDIKEDTPRLAFVYGSETIHQIDNAVFPNVAVLMVEEDDTHFKDVRNLMFISSVIDSMETRKQTLAKLIQPIEETP